MRQNYSQITDLHSPFLLFLKLCFINLSTYIKEKLKYYMLIDIRQ